MSDTTLPAWPNKPWGDYPESIYGIEVWHFDVARLDAFDAEVAKVQAARDEIIAADARNFDAAVAAVRALGFASSGSRATGRRKRNGMPERESFDLKTALRWFMPVGYEKPMWGDSKPDTKREREWLAAKAKRDIDDAARRSREAESDALATRAVAWLMARGKILGTDFTVGNALDTANEIAAAEEKARMTAAGKPIAFSGDDEGCENCEGWIPGSRRCCCGNRRVDFATHDGHTFENVCVFAEAY